VRAAWAVVVPRDVGEGRAFAAQVKFVLLSLADHADEGGVCWPGVRRLVLLTQLSERTVQRALQALQGLGWVQVRAYEHGGRGRATEYLLTLPDVEPGDDKPRPQGTLLGLQTPSSGHPLLSSGAHRTPFRSETPSTGHPLRGPGGRKGVSSARKGVSSETPEWHLSPETVASSAEKARQQPPESPEPSEGGGPSGAGSDPPAGGHVAPSDGITSREPVPTPAPQRPPDREQGSTRATSLVHALTSAIIGPEDDGDGELVFGFKLTEVRTSIERASPSVQVTLQKFYRWLVSRGADHRVVQACLAYTVMKKVANPFAYFAPGQPARIAAEQWARG
jgi:helix-turn-helix protein